MIEKVTKTNLMSFEILPVFRILNFSKREMLSVFLLVSNVYII